MANSPPFELQDGHKFFAAHCFNRTWDFIEKRSRTEAEDTEMLRSCLTSLWHWSQREDATPRNFAVGYWQASRVYALLGNVEEARRYGRMSLEKSEGLDPFFAGFAHEALARSEMVAGNKSLMYDHLNAARELCEKVTDSENRRMLAADLDTIR